MMKTGMMKIFQITTNCKIFGNDLKKGKPRQKNVFCCWKTVYLCGRAFSTLYICLKEHTHTLTLLPIATKNLIFTPHTSVVLFGMIFSNLWVSVFGCRETALCGALCASVTGRGFLSRTGPVRLH